MTHFEIMEMSRTFGPNKQPKREIRLWALLRCTAMLMLLTVSGSALAQNKKDSKTKPATDEDIFLYRGIGSSYVCNARIAGVEFPKAVGIAAASYTQLLNGRHGGFVKSAGKKKLTNKQLFNGAEFQLITGAMQYCPKEVPDDVKEKLKKAIEKDQSQKKTKKDKKKRR